MHLLRIWTRGWGASGHTVSAVIVVGSLLACRTEGSLKVRETEIRFFNCTQAPAASALPVLVYSARDGSSIVEPTPKYSHRRVEGAIVGRESDGSYRVRYPTRRLEAPRRGVIAARSEGWWADVVVPAALAKARVVAPYTLQEAAPASLRQLPSKRVSAEQVAKRFATVSFVQFAAAPISLVSENGQPLRDFLPREVVDSGMIRVQVQTSLDEGGIGGGYPCVGATTRLDVPIRTLADAQAPGTHLPTLPEKVFIHLEAPPGEISQRICVELLMTKERKPVSGWRRLIFDRTFSEPAASFEGYAEGVTRLIATRDWTVPCPAQSVYQPSPTGDGTCVANGSERKPVAGRGPSMVRIPGGTFLMGDGSDGASRRVRVASFLLDRTEVSGGQYHECVQTGVCTPPGTAAHGFDRPETKVDVVQAETFCEWAGKRLPSEEQWEYAARGTDGRRYPWGNTEPTKETVCMRRERCVPGTHPLGASPFGIHDMSSNADEWVSTGWCVVAPCTIGEAPPEHPVTRGGNAEDAYFGRAQAPERMIALRATQSSEAPYGGAGFRCAAP